MNCPDCKRPTEMNIDFLDINEARDMFEVVLKCPRCKAVFFGTIYRGEEKEVVCEECEEEK